MMQLKHSGMSSWKLRAGTYCLLLCLAWDNKVNWVTEPAISVSHGRNNLEQGLQIQIPTKARSGIETKKNCHDLGKMGLDLISALSKVKTQSFRTPGLVAGNWKSGFSWKIRSNEIMTKQTKKTTWNTKKAKHKILTGYMVLRATVPECVVFYTEPEDAQDCLFYQDGCCLSTGKCSCTCVNVFVHM